MGGGPGVGMGVPGLMSRPQLLEPQQADIECDPRELEAFAEHFKQRRIKLSVTQVCLQNMNIKIIQKKEIFNF